MKIAVFGTGGIGGIYGTRLHAAGQEVHFIARGAHLAAMRENGLTVETEGGIRRHEGISATDDPASIGPVDIVLFGVKLWDTESAATACRPLLGADTAVLSLQNGIDAYPVLARVLGTQHALAGVAEVSAVIAGPGLIRQTGTFTRIRAGEEDGRESERLTAFAAACAAADIEYIPSPDIAADRWRKFALIVAGSGLTAVTRQTVGTVRSDPHMRATFAACLEETIAVGRAEGVELEPDLGSKLMGFVEALPEDMRASMAADLAAGRRLELPWLSGRVSALGRELGVPTPVNDTLYAALKPYEMGR